MIVKQLIAVFVGGGLGSLLRFGISYYFAKHIKLIPLGTFVSNITASVLLAVVMWWMLAKHHDEYLLRLLLITGFCGGFSTFSTFSFETFQLLKDGHILVAVANILISVFLALTAMYFILRNY